MLLFGSGKLVCTGAKKPHDVEEAIEHIDAELRWLTYCDRRHF